MITSSLPRKRVILIISFLCVLYLWVGLGRPTPIQRTLSPDESRVERFNVAAIQAVCSEQQWVPGLVFTCDKSFGGVGNLRNSILNCVRYAIGAGASLVVPRIVVRNPADIYETITEEISEMDYMFNKKHFVDSLKHACPQLQLYNNISDFPYYLSAHEPITLLPESLEQSIPKSGLQQPERWHERFYAWLTQYSTPSLESPMIINLERSYLQYPVYYDGADFALNFGKILKFRDDALHLSKVALRELSNSLSLDLSKPINPNAFFGVHLRTESDAVRAWPPQDRGFWKNAGYPVQSQFYLSQALRSELSVIFLASGDQTEVAKFTKDALAKNLTVITKTDLLKGKDLEALNSWAWDRQALVDFMILLRATDFAGIAHSSFAWNIALQRHIYSNVSNHLDGPQMLSDEFSQIYGDVRGYPEYAACMWP